MRRAEIVTLAADLFIVAGSSLGTPSTMNGIVLHTVGERWSPAPAAAASQRKEEEEVSRA